MKRRAQSPLLDEERPRRSKRMYRQDGLRDTQVNTPPIVT